MTTLYVLRNYGGERDDYWEQNVAASLDKAKLETLRDQLLVRTKTGAELQAKLQAHLYSLYASVPAPATEIRTPVPYSHVKKNEMTDAMRKERDRVQNNNARISKEQNAILVERNKKILALQKEYIASLGATEQELNDCNLSESSSYTIEEIDFLE